MKEKELIVGFAIHFDYCHIIHYRQRCDDSPCLSIHVGIRQNMPYTNLGSECCKDKRRGSRQDFHGVHVIRGETEILGEFRYR